MNTTGDIHNNSHQSDSRYMNSSYISMGNGSSLQVFEEDSLNSSGLASAMLMMPPMHLPLLQPHVRCDAWGMCVENILRGYCARGELMISWEAFIRDINTVKDQLPNIEQLTLEQILAKTTELYHQTIRKFGDSKSSFYVSVRLSSISVEAIVWILQSIRRDYMTPSEKLIFSRIKECFGYKLNQCEWTSLMNHLKSLAIQPENIITFASASQLPSLQLLK
jgi:hypothetical protein